ncbi:MAG: thioredoxin domain-containing protein [Chloroflexi bacterium]|nr:thioredoxin domain-containing protein [Chloroflexota bacterium]
MLEEPRHPRIIAAFWKATLRNPHVSLIARLLVGVVFIWSAGGKIAYPEEFARLMDAYGVLPTSVTPGVAVLVTWAELLLGAFLVLGVATRLTAVAASTLLAIFLAAMSLMVVQGKSVDCGCFVGIVQETVGPWTLARDTFLLVVALVAVMSTSHRWSADSLLGLGRRRLVRSVALASATGALVLAIGLFFGASVPKMPAEAPPSATAPASQAGPAGRPEGGWRLGPPNAPVVITEFSDFQCPACQATSPILEKLVEDFRGQVALVYRHFPLPQHQDAVPAAEAAEAAGEQGKFWEMHDLIFADQERMSLADLRARAVRLRLDTKRFDEALLSGRTRAQVAADYNEGRRVGVRYTPYILVNGEVFADHSYNGLRAKIERELKK